MHTHTKIEIDGDRESEREVIIYMFQAVRLLTQIKRRETARVEGARGRTGAAAAGATSGTEAVLINSMTQMAQVLSFPHCLQVSCSGFRV